MDGAGGQYGLDDVLHTLRMHRDALRRLGVSHAAVFGSVARGESGGESDLDLLVDLDLGRLEDVSLG
jgi:predicted nucleotidyltransferase